MIINILSIILVKRRFKFLTMMGRWWVCSLDTVLYYYYYFGNYEFFSFAFFIFLLSFWRVKRFLDCTDYICKKVWSCFSALRYYTIHALSCTKNDDIIWGEYQQQLDTSHESSHWDGYICATIAASTSGFGKLRSFRSSFHITRWCING